MMLANKYGGDVDVFIGDGPGADRQATVEHCGSVGKDPIIISVGLDESDEREEA